MAGYPRVVNPGGYPGTWYPPTSRCWSGVRVLVMCMTILKKQQELATQNTFGRFPYSALSYDTAHFPLFVFQVFQVCHDFLGFPG